MHWLIEEQTMAHLREAVKSGSIPDASAEAEYEARVAAEGGLLRVSGDHGAIDISGVLTRRPSLFAKFFGGGNTTYGSIVQALAEAQADPAVKTIHLNVDSPGGEFAGLFDVLGAMQGVKKKMVANVGTMAASAAYAIVSQADEIIAQNRATQVGSIGVVASFFVSDHFVDLTSTEAPNKRPDVKTPEGRAAVVEHLDELHNIFVDAIATGRNVTVEAVNATFGRGATLLAEKAMGRGMIDAIAGGGTNSGGDDHMEAQMDIQTLKKEHSEVYAQVRAEGFEEGKTAERDRVNGHLVMGEASGDMKTAIEAISEGTEMTQTLQAKYMAAGMNRKDRSNREADEAVAAAAAGKPEAPESTDIVDAVVTELEKAFGKEVTS